MGEGIDTLNFNFAIVARDIKCNSLIFYLHFYFKILAFFLFLVSFFASGVGYKNKLEL